MLPSQAGYNRITLVISDIDDHLFKDILFQGYNTVIIRYTNLGH